MLLHSSVGQPRPIELLVALVGGLDSFKTLCIFSKAARKYDIYACRWHQLLKIAVWEFRHKVAALKL